MPKKLYSVFIALFFFTTLATTFTAEDSAAKITGMPKIHETSLCPPLNQGYQIIPDSLKFSPDLREVAYVAHADNTQNIVVINDKISPVYYAIYPGTPLFSADKNRCAYIAYKNKDQAIVVVDGKPSDILDTADNFTFSPDGSRYAFRGQKNKKQFVVVNGISEPDYDGILIRNNFLFSPNSKKFLYVAYNNNACFAVVDGKAESNSFNFIEYVVFSPNSMHYAYKARTEKKGMTEKWCVVRDGKPEAVYDKIFDIVFSHDSNHMAYTAIKDRQMVMVVDGKEIADGDVMGYPVFSWDSKNFAYAFSKKDKWYIVVNDQKSSSFDKVYKFQFSPDSQRYSYIANNSKTWLCVVDGKEGPQFKNAIDVFKFSPDSQRYAYIGVNSEGSRMITDTGLSKKSYASLGEAYFSPGSRHLVFRSRNKPGGKWVTNLNGEERFNAYQAIGKYEFSSDSRHLAVPVFNNINQTLMLVDGDEQCADHQFKILGNPYFSPNGDYVVYHAMANENEWYLIINGEPLENSYGGFMKTTPVIFDGPNKFHTLALRDPGPDFVLIEVDIPETFPILESKLE